MKNTFKSTLIVAVCFTLFCVGCVNEKAPETETIPFTANATGEYKYVGPDTLPDVKCTGDLSAWRAIVEGTGTGDPIGDFSVHFDFCGDTLGNYGNGFAFMVTEESDSIFFSVAGQVLQGRMEDHPEFVTSYWRDSFEITSGTGKYAGVTGNLVSDDYNSSEDPNSHHNWKGTISVKKEKK